MMSELNLLYENNKLTKANTEIYLKISNEIGLEIRGRKPNTNLFRNELQEKVKHIMNEN
jgi:hypothetical protein